MQFVPSKAPRRVDAADRIGRARVRRAAAAAAAVVELSTFVGANVMSPELHAASAAVSETEVKSSPVVHLLLLRSIGKRWRRGRVDSARVPRRVAMERHSRARDV